VTKFLFAGTVPVNNSVLNYNLIAAHALRTVKGFGRSGRPFSFIN
jgi:hypothetical protein